MRDFFISYNSADKTWAEWIAWVLEEHSYTVIIQAWDFRPGGNFILDMQRATAEAQRTIMVLSDAYLKALYTQPEWAAAFTQDPTAANRKLLPVRVAPCQPTGMLASLVYVDLVGKSETEAETLLLAALQDRAKPTTRPSFPQAAPADRVTPPTVAFPPSPPPLHPPTTYRPFQAAPAPKSTTPPPPFSLAPSAAAPSTSPTPREHPPLNPRPTYPPLHHPPPNAWPSSKSWLASPAPSLSKFSLPSTRQGAMCPPPRLPRLTGSKPCSIGPPASAPA